MEVGSDLTDDGSITVTGTGGGGGGGGFGVDLEKTVTATNGSVTIKGTGSTTGNASDDGVDVNEAISAGTSVSITGQGNVIYPEFKGYFSDFYWMRMETAGQPFAIVCADEDVYLRLFTPADPVKTYNVAPPFPSGDISFMHAIPPIGTKSQKPEKMGPSGEKNMYYDYSHSKDYAKVLTLYFDFSGK